MFFFLISLLRNISDNFNLIFQGKQGLIIYSTPFVDRGLESGNTLTNRALRESVKTELQSENYG